MQSEEVVLLDSDDDEKAPGINSYTKTNISNKAISKLYHTIPVILYHVLTIVT